MTSIETHIYLTDLYRATSAPNPLPNPLEYIPTQSSLVQKTREQHEQIESLVQQYGLPSFSKYGIWVGKLHKPGYPHGEEPQLTLLIEYKGENGTFERAKTGLPEVEFEIDGLPVDVEVAHFDYCCRPSLFPVSPKHPAVGGWERVREGVVKLCASIPSIWTMTSLFMVGPYLEKSAPAIVVMVRPGSVYNWTELIASIRSLIHEVAVA